MASAGIQIYAFDVVIDGTPCNTDGMSAHQVTASISALERMNLIFENHQGYDMFLYMP